MEYQFEGNENAITAEHLLKNLGYKVETKHIEYID